MSIYVSIFFMIYFYFGCNFRGYIYLWVIIIINIEGYLSLEMNDFILYQFYLMNLYLEMNGSFFFE